MTKKELAAKLADKTDLSVAKATEILSLIFDATPGKGLIASELEGGNKVTIPGFGTFELRSRGPRKGTNPSTGKTLEIPARNYVHFKAGKTMKERLQ